MRHRVTLNTYYELPFGLHKKYLNQRGVVEELAGGWATDVTFAAQTGVPFSVSPDISTASQSGATNAYAIRVGDPFRGGGSPDPSNPGVACPAQVKNRTNWYNPCAFANPLPGTNIPQSGPGSLVTGLANAMAYLGGPANQIHGPGYARVSMSLFKSFPVWREQALQFRADIFNVTNTPSLGTPGNTNNSPAAGQITGPKFFQNLTPDSRFFQLALKVLFLVSRSPRRPHHAGRRALCRCQLRCQARGDSSAPRAPHGNHRSLASRGGPLDPRAKWAFRRLERPD